MKAYNLETNIKSEREGSCILTLGKDIDNQINIICPCNVQDGDNVSLYTVQDETIVIHEALPQNDQDYWLTRVNTIKGFYVEIKAPQNAEVEVIASVKKYSDNENEIVNYGDYLLKIKDNTIIMVQPHQANEEPYYLAFGEDKVEEVKERDIYSFLVSKPVKSPKYSFGEMIRI